MIGLLHEKERLLLRTELKEYFLHRRSLHFFPLVFFGVFLMAWIYPVASPMAPIVVIVIAALESQFNNIFYRTGNELEAMALFPLAWRRIILIKNLCTIILLVALIALTSMALLYFSPDKMTYDRWGEAFAWVATIIFPLLHIGNGQSIRRPRRATGLQIGDLVETLWMMVNLALASIPYYLFVYVFHLRVLCLVYALLAGVLWYRYSLKRTARQIEREIPTLCSQ